MSEAQEGMTRKPKVQVVGTRVDALVVAWTLQVYEDSWHAIVDALQADIRRLDGALRLDGWDDELAHLGVGWQQWACHVRRHKSGRITIRTDRVRGVLDVDAARWQLELTARQIWLGSVPAKQAVSELRAIARLFGVVTEERLRRIDLCADVAGWEIRASDADGFVGRPRAKMAYWTRPVVETYHRSRQCTGHTVCPGNTIMLRIYDKLAELHAQGRTPTERLSRVHKLELETVGWSLGGWDGRAPIARVEFQIRGEACRELWQRSVDRAMDSLDGTWRYLTESWFREAVPDATLRTARWPSSARWRAVQAATFIAVAARPIRRLRQRGYAHWKTSLGSMLGQLRRCGDLDGSLLDMPEPDALRAVAERWIGVTTEAARVDGGDQVRHAIDVALARMGWMPSDDGCPQSCVVAGGMMCEGTVSHEKQEGGSDALCAASGCMGVHSAQRSQGIALRFDP